MTGQDERIACIRTVFPANVTVALGSNFDRLMVLDAGAERFEIRIFVHDFTAEESDA